MEDWIQVWTDGSGLGGWAVIWLYRGKVTELSGADHENPDPYRMELTAVLVALAHLPNGQRIMLTSDCQPVLRAARNPVQRSRERASDLWVAVDFHVARHMDVRWVWTKGHAHNPFNERVDELARIAALKG